MARSAPVTAAELLRQLEANPDWVSRRNAGERDRARRQQRSREAQASLLRDLEATGTKVSDVWDLVNSQTPYPEALPVLLDHLSKPYADGILEGIARALAVKDARPIAWDRLVALVRSKSLPKRVADGIMVALSAMARPADLATVIALIGDGSIGSSRVLLVRNLMRSKKPDARRALLELRADADLEITACRREHE